MPGQRTRTAFVAFLLLPLATFIPLPALPQTKRIPSDADLATIGQRRIDRAPNLYSHDQEQKLGETLASLVQRSSKLVTDPGVTGYMNRIAAELSKNSDVRFPVKVTVIDSEVINAFTAPAGFQFVNAGLILQTQNEAELAGVLAHGIAHTALRTGTNTSTKGFLPQLATVPLMELGPSGWADYGLSEGLNLAVPFPYMKQRRDAELDADYFALQYLSESGYDPECYVEFMDRVWPLTSAAKYNVQTWSPYPPLADRLKAMGREIAEILPQQAAARISSAEFENVKERLQLWSLAYSGSKGIPDPRKPILRKK